MDNKIKLKCDYYDEDSCTIKTELEFDFNQLLYLKSNNIFVHYSPAWIYRLEFERIVRERWHLTKFYLPDLKDNINEQIETLEFEKDRSQFRSLKEIIKDIPITEEEK